MLVVHANGQRPWIRETGRGSFFSCLLEAMLEDVRLIQPLVVTLAGRQQVVLVLVGVMRGTRHKNRFSSEVSAVRDITARNADEA